MSFCYPILLDLANRRAVLIGGGSVAARKAQALLDAGCVDIVAVAPVFSGHLPDMVKRVTEEYQSHHLDGAFLVFAATNQPEVNEQVVRDAEGRGLLVGRPDFDESAPGNFSNPAVYRQGPLTIAVSAGGSPTLAAEIRDALAENLSPGYATLAEIMQSIRPAIRSGIADSEQRRAIFHDLASPAVLELVNREGKEAVWKWLIKKYPMLK